jgi:transglutaminase-like putative cysteine protease
MERRPFSAGHAWLIAFAAVSLAAPAVSLGIGWILLLVPAMIASGFWRVARTPQKIALVIRWVGLLCVVGLGALPLLSTFQLMYIEPAIRYAAPVGAALGVVMTLLLFSPTPVQTTIPASIALLAVAGLRREAPYLLPLFAGAAACLAFHLAAHRRLRIVPLAAFGILGAAAAAGVCMLLPWAQPWVEAKAADFITPAQGGRAGLSLTSRLGEIEALAMSPEIAMRVWTTTPQYLRARVYTHFNGQSWAQWGAESRRPLAAAPDLDPELAGWLEEIPGTTLSVHGAAGTAPLVRTRILHENPKLKVIPAPGQVRVARLSPALAWVDDAGILVPAEGPPRLYATVNRRDRDVVQPDRPPTPDCLDTRRVVDRRLRDLAETLRAGAGPAERVRRTVDYLETNCTYSLNVGAFRSTDPVAEFVFDKKRGYCEYFASACVLLLRLQEVPARYVVGYAVSPSNFEGGHYIVREADAHAWVEAYLPDRGWVEVDPTPAAQFEAMRAPLRGGAISGAWERVKAWVSELIAIVRQGGAMAAVRRAALPVLGIGAAVAIVVWGLVSGRKRLRGLFTRRRSKAAESADAGAVPAELTELMRALDRLWTRSGHPRPPGRAPLEHLQGLPAPARVGDAVVEAFYRCRYGGFVPSGGELAGLRQALGDRR